MLQTVSKPELWRETLFLFSKTVYYTNPYTYSPEQKPSVPLFTRHAKILGTHGHLFSNVLFSYYCRSCSWYFEKIILLMLSEQYMYVSVRTFLFQWVNLSPLNITPIKKCTGLLKLFLLITTICNLKKVEYRLSFFWIIFLESIMLHICQVLCWMCRNYICSNHRTTVLL